MSGDNRIVGDELKQKYFAITIDGKRCVTDMHDVAGILIEELRALEVGDSFTVEAIEMTQEEFDGLVEFEGW